jgi:acylphosphatase
MTVCGRVQGVFFRHTTKTRAAALGLRGWVRNLPDGRVEVLAEGSRAALELLVAFCQEGPPRARVDRLDVTWSDATGEHEGFETVR